MRALVVFPFPLDPEGGAAQRCGIGLLRGLSDLGLDYRAVAADPQARPPAPPPADLAVETVPYEHPSRMATRAVRYLMPYRTLLLTPFAARVRELAREADVVHTVGLAGAGAVRGVDGPVVAQIDCSTRLDRDVEPVWTAAGRTALELLRAERRAARLGDAVLASSEEVAASLRKTTRTPVTVAPLSLDGGLYRPSATLEEPVAGLIGTADWPPTADAVKRLLEEVWPRVRERLPNARLRLAGFGMDREAFGRLADAPGVEWCGSVASAVDFIRDLSVLLYPVGRGSGIKIKVLEALALGVPVVTTPAGAEGLGGSGGVAVETDAAALADATVALLADPGVRRAAGEAAVRTFADHHAPAVAARPVVDLYERLVAAR